MKLMRKLFLNGSRVIQSLFDLSTPDKEKPSDILKRFAKIFLQMKGLQFRDMIMSLEEEFFGTILEVRATKKESGGSYYLADYMMTF